MKSQTAEDVIKNEEEAENVQRKGKGGTVREGATRALMCKTRRVALTR